MTKDVTAERLDRPTLVSMALCAIPVATFSAWSQFETASMAGVPSQLAWVLPVTTDATGFVATRIWLNPLNSPGTRKYAAFIALCCISLAFVGAAIHLVLGGEPAPAWLRLAVGGLPSLALAALVHLGALLVAQRREKVKPAEKPARTPKSKSKATPQNVGAVEHVRPPTSTAPALQSQVDLSTGTGSELKAVPEIATSVASPEVGIGSNRERMMAYLDEVNGQATGAELDRRFGTNNYGRGVLNAWKKHHPMASGE